MRTIVSLVAVAVIVAGCATGIQSESDTNDSTESTGGGDGSGGGGATTTSTTGGMGAGGEMGGMGGGGPQCAPPQHFCGGLCVDNTPATGCYQSTSCSACPTPTNGTATCTTDGLCDVNCTSPYVKNGSSCNCPTQCCSNTDCQSGETCENGSCVTPCDLPTCIATCLLQNKVGICLNDVCVCQNP